MCLPKQKISDGFNSVKVLTFTVERKTKNKRCRKKTNKQTKKSDRVDDERWN